jgi:hypothetical protein
VILRSAAAASRRKPLLRPNIKALGPGFRRDVTRFGYSTLGPGFRRDVTRFGYSTLGPGFRRDVTRFASYVFGSVTPFWPWYLPPRSLYEVSQTSSDSRNSICATPSLA